MSTRRRVWLSTSSVWRGKGLTDYAPATGALPYEYSDTNVPWAYTGSTQSAREAEFLANWPAGWPSVPTIVDIQTGGANFYTNLNNTVNAAGGRVIVRLSAGTYHLTSFQLIGSSGNQLYAFGFWHPNLAGIIGQGADQTTIQMDAGSVSGAQLSAIAALTKASGQANQLGMMRLDGSSTSPVVFAGVTIQAADQPLVTSFQADNGIAGNQPAPHSGIVFYQNAYFYVSHVRARGAARACTSLPPFEHGNFNSQYENGYYFNVEIDGRRAAELDSNRPRRCGALLGNNATVHYMKNFWIHHTNVSRYAMNDQNANTSGVYTACYGKLENISNIRNTDPNLNGGATLGGYTNATPFGWESCNGTINLDNLIIQQDNAYTDVQIAQHLQLTTVGSRNPQGGRLHATNITARCSVWPQLDGYLCFRMPTGTYWVSDGYATTLDVKHTSGASKTAYVYSGTWPPSSAVLTAAGISPSTHYIVRNS